MATWLKKLGSWSKKNGGLLAKVGLAGVGFAAGMVAPGVGATIGKLADKFGNKAAAMTGIADGKRGILGIGDRLPGILGIGTGKNIEDAVRRFASEKVKTLESKAELTSIEKDELALAKRQAGSDMKKEGVNPLFILGGGLLALFALRK